MKILLAVDGSKTALRAVQCVIEHADWYAESPNVELVTVQMEVPQLRRLGISLGKNRIREYYQAEGAKALARARRALDEARIRYTARILVGPISDTIVRQAKTRRCDLIAIGTRGMTAAGNMLLGSIATKVVHGASVPVLLVK
jgi:nucleotide-binding universal stress UspA family protein